MTMTESIVTDKASLDRLAAAPCAMVFDVV
jgi:hypothetical protein